MNLLDRLKSIDVNHHLHEVTYDKDFQKVIDKISGEEQKEFLKLIYIYLSGQKFNPGLTDRQYSHFDEILCIASSRSKERKRKITPDYFFHALEIAQPVEKYKKSVHSFKFHEPISVVNSS